MLIIYGIQHNQTKRIYIGKTTNTSRIKVHFNDLRSGRHTNKEMQSDYDNYGDDFSVYLLEIVPKGTHEDREAYWMMYFNTSHPSFGYNTKDIKAKKADISQFPYFMPQFEFEVEGQRDKITKAEHQFWKSQKRKGKRKSERPQPESYKNYAIHRDAKGLKDFDVAKECKISTSTISDWKNGRSRPNAEKLLKICKLLDMSIEEMVGVDE